MKVTVYNKGEVIKEIAESQVPRFTDILNIAYDGEAKSITIGYVDEPNGTSYTFSQGCGQWDKVVLEFPMQSQTQP